MRPSQKDTKRPNSKPESFDALKATLLADANRSHLIAEGEAVASSVRIVPFHLDPVPLMTLTVVYTKR
jgi:hypothetical protein